MARNRSSDAHGPAWLVQAAEIAHHFYVEGRSKVEIADELGLSRFKVARIIEEAREQGLVRVSVQLPASIDGEASTALHHRLGLRRAIVLGRDTTHNRVREDIGRLAAELLSELVADGDVLGLTCSRSVTAATDALTALAPCPVVQLTGTLAGPDGETGSVESVRRAAGVGGGIAFPVYAPMVLPNASTARSLARQTAVRHSLDRIGSVTIAMVSIGGWAEGLSTVWPASSQRERSAAIRAGAVGEIGGRVFDASGAAVTAGVDDRVLGATLAQLREVDEVIGLAFGDERAAATYSAVTGGLVDTLVCDHAMAEALLELASEREEVV